MPYIQPDIDDDQLAAFLANPARAAAMKQQGLVPPGVDPRAIAPPPPPMSADAGSSAQPIVAPPAVNVAQPAVAAAPAPAMVPARPQPPTAPSMADDPYAQKISDLRTKISQANPKWWERALGGLSAGMIAYGSHDPASAVEIGQGVTNRRRDSLQSQLNPLQQQETDYRARTEKEFSDKTKSYEDTIKQQRADADEELKRAHAGRFDYLSMSPKERADQVADLENTSGLKFTPLEKSSFILSGKIPTREQKPSLPELMKQREQEGTAAGLKGDALMFYKLNGKLREPNPEAEARLEDARSRHADSEADRHQREDDSNFNHDQSRLAAYTNRKDSIQARERAAFQKLEDEARDKKTGNIINPGDLEGRKKEIQKQFEDEYSALGAPPQERVVDRGGKQPAAAPRQNELNGKLREPNPEAEARLEDARSRHADSEADRHQREDDSNFNKSATRTAEYNKQKAAIDERKAKAYQDLEDKVRQKNNRTATGEVDDVTLNNRKAAIEKEFASAYASLGAPPQERVVDRGGKQPAAAPRQNAASQAPTQGKPQLAIGAKVSVGGKSYTVKGFNPKTGKPIVGE